LGKVAAFGFPDEPPKRNEPDRIAEDELGLLRSLSKPPLPPQRAEQTSFATEKRTAPMRGTTIF